MHGPLFSLLERDDDGILFGEMLLLCDAVVNCQNIKRLLFLLTQSLSISHIYLHTQWINSVVLHPNWVANLVLNLVLNLVPTLVLILRTMVTRVCTRCEDDIE